MAMFIPKDRKSLFRQFLSGMYDAVVITDPNGHIIEINGRASEFFGYVQDELVDKHVSELIVGLNADIVKRIRTGLADDRHVMIDANGLDKDGEKFACEVTISMLELTDPDDLVFTIRNVERRRKMQEILRSKEAAFGISASALFTCNPEGQITNANQAFLAMFGLEDAEEARNHAFADYFGDAPLPESFKKALGGETLEVAVVAQSEEKGGADESLEVTLAPIVVGRKIRGVAGSVTKG